MTGPDFVDTNVLVYAYVSTDPRKQGIAKDIVRRAIAGEGTASTQVLSEFASTFLRKFSPHGHCPKRERSWNAGSDGRRLAPVSRARVVYCQRIENNRFAVGSELFAPL
jgi:predicted nucleic acid-binding protein